MSSGLQSSSSLFSEIALPKLEAIVDADRPICKPWQELGYLHTLLNYKMAPLAKAILNRCMHTPTLNKHLNCILTVSRKLRCIEMTIKPRLAYILYTIMYLCVIHTTINVTNKHVYGSIISPLTQLQQLVKTEQKELKTR